MNLWSIFLTGLLTGGLSCLAVQGGLLTSVIANEKNQEEGKSLKPTSFDQLDWLPVVMFLLTKLISHTLLGFLLGAVGSFFELSLPVRLAFQVFTALFMFATAMNLLHVHPIFRFVVLQPPKFVRKLLKNQTKSTALFTPAILGFLTVLIPCGVTQAVEVTALSSGNAISGALIMAAFVLGTSPLFTLIGVATAKLSEIWHDRFTLVAALLLIFMTVYTINGVLVVTNSPLTFQTVKENVEMMVTPPQLYQQRSGSKTNNSTILVEDGVQKVKIDIKSSGYAPRYIKVKRGMPVELELKSVESYSCANEFVMKEFNISLRLRPTDDKKVAFTPEKNGKYPFSCAMGMYTGTFEVADHV
jgi:sulfite exporter TauE/SafE